MSEESCPQGRYRELAPLGSGGFANVHRYLDRRLGRLVAVKRLQDTAVARPEVVTSFDREVRVLSYLDHPGLLPLYDRVEGQEEAPAYTMRLVEGRTLEEHIEFRVPEYRSTPQRLTDAVRIVERLCETLSHVHDRGILHLDLKPENIMIGRYGEVLLLDWGSSRLFDPEPYRAYLGDHASEEDLAILSEEPAFRIMGSPLFLSPEQIDGDRSVLRPPADVFAVGVIFYLLVFGRPPFLGGSVPETLLKIQTMQLPEISSTDRMRHGVPQRLTEIIWRMLEKDPASRYPDFHAVLAALEDYRNAGSGFELLELGRDEVLFSEGEPGDVAYSIVSGEVRIERDTPEGVRVVAELGPGEVLGELAILASRPRSATARATQPTTLRVIPGDRLMSELEKLKPWMSGIIQTIATRFLHLLEEGDGPGEAKGD